MLQPPTAMSLAAQIATLFSWAHIPMTTASKRPKKDFRCSRYSVLRFSLLLCPLKKEDSLMRRTQPLNWLKFCCAAAALAALGQRCFLRHRCRPWCLPSLKANRVRHPLAQSAYFRHTGGRWLLETPLPWIMRPADCCLAGTAAPFSGTCVGLGSSDQLRVARAFGVRVQQAHALGLQQK